MTRFIEDLALKTAQSSCDQMLIKKGNVIKTLRKNCDMKGSNKNTAYVEYVESFLFLEFAALKT